MKRDVRSTAERMGVKRKTLDNWRCAKKGPPFYRIGGRVVYDDDEVERWLAERRYINSGESAA